MIDDVKVWVLFSVDSIVLFCLCSLWSWCCIDFGVKVFVVCGVFNDCLMLCICRCSVLLVEIVRFCMFCISFCGLVKVVSVLVCMVGFVLLFIIICGYMVFGYVLSN